MTKRRTRCVHLVLTAWFVGFPSWSGATPLVEQVSATRASVDALAEELASHRRSAREQRAALRAERAELQRLVRLEEVRRDTLVRLQTEQTARMDDQEGFILTLLAPIKRAVVSAKKYVSSTLPFKQDERLRRLNKIESDLAVTHPDASRALTQIWRFVEEEEAMTREIGLAQQAITLDGQRLLVDVARVGMALMYFRLPNGEVGWARQASGTWRYERIKSADARQTVSSFFEALESNRVLGPRRLLLPEPLPKLVDEPRQ